MGLDIIYYLVTLYLSGIFFWFPAVRFSMLFISDGWKLEVGIKNCALSMLFVVLFAICYFHAICFPNWEHLRTRTLGNKHKNKNLVTKQTWNGASVKPRHSQIFAGNRRRLPRRTSRLDCQKHMRQKVLTNTSLFRSCSSMSQSCKELSTGHSPTIWQFDSAFGSHEQSTSTNPCTIEVFWKASWTGMVWLKPVKGSPRGSQTASGTRLLRRVWALTVDRPVLQNILWRRRNCSIRWPQEKQAQMHLWFPPIA